MVVLDQGNAFFCFARINFINSATQLQIYTRAAAPIIDSVLEGFNGTIFAYGQTAAGKVSSCSIVVFTHCFACRPTR